MGNRRSFFKYPDMRVMGVDISQQMIAYLPRRETFGVVPMLGAFLRQAGYINIQHKAHIVDFSFDTEAHDGWYQNFTISFQLLQPFLVKMKVTTPEEVDQLYHQAREEMVKPEFRAVWFYLSVWGEKVEE